MAAVRRIAAVSAALPRRAAMSTARLLPEEMTDVRFNPELAQSAATNVPEVLLHGSSHTRAITLNRPKALNALTLPMVREMTRLLRMLEPATGSATTVIIQAAGRKAFCAGGDVRAIAEAAQKRDALVRDFFAEEYNLNFLMGTYTKPLIAFMDGITMGGGVGISVHGMFRIATENTVFAMPETGIGLFPDVGGSFFLSRMDGQLGMYLALTGSRLKGIETFKAGIATHYVPSNMLSTLEQRLGQIQFKTGAHVATVIDELTSEDVFRQFEIKHRAEIDEVFSASSVEEIIARLNERKDMSDWAADTLGKLYRMSPTSLKVTFEQIRRGSKLDFDQCFEMEYRLTQRICNPKRTDFFEGVRAVLIDKDMKPRWKPASLAEVSDAMVAEMFEPLSIERDGVRDLQLQKRTTFPQYPTMYRLPPEEIILDFIRGEKEVNADQLLRLVTVQSGQKAGVQQHVREILSRRCQIVSHPATHRKRLVVKSEHV